MLVPVHVLLLVNKSSVSEVVKIILPPESKAKKLPAPALEPLTVVRFNPEEAVSCPLKVFIPDHVLLLVNKSPVSEVVKIILPSESKAKKLPAPALEPLTVVKFNPEEAVSCPVTTVMSVEASPRVTSPLAFSVVHSIVDLLLAPIGVPSIAPPSIFIESSAALSIKLALVIFRIVPAAPSSIITKSPSATIAVAGRFATSKLNVKSYGSASVPFEVSVQLISMPFPSINLTSFPSDIVTSVPSPSSS